MAIEVLPDGCCFLNGQPARQNCAKHGGSAPTTHDVARKGPSAPKDAQSAAKAKTAAPAASDAKREQNAWDARHSGRKLKPGHYRLNKATGQVEKVEGSK